jgi:hypothetical protein
MSLPLKVYLDYSKSINPNYSFCNNYSFYFNSSSSFSPLTSSRLKSNVTIHFIYPINNTSINPSNMPTIFVTGLAGLQYQGLESEYIGESKAIELRG